MSKGFTSSYRTGLLATLLLICFAGIGARLVWLHEIDRDELLPFTVTARGQNQPIPEFARRGDILDQRGAVLATSRSLRLVWVDPGLLRDKDESKWPQLAELLHMPLPALKKILTTKFRLPAPAKSVPATSATTPTGGLVFNFNLPPTASANAAVTSGAVVLTPPASAASATDDRDGESEELDPTPDKDGRKKIWYAILADNVSESTYLEIKKLDIRGVTGDRVYRRTYPHNELAAHVVGYVDRSQRAATGIERYADFYLRGQDGWREGERDGRNRELAQFRTREVPRADGYSVKLSLDANVQDIVEQELALIAQKYQPLKATIIVSDPRTGFILGLGNYPSFNPNEFNKVAAGAQASMNNIALTDVYEPGSVFKIVAASGALEEGLVTPETTFDCTLASKMYQGTQPNKNYPILRKLPSEDKSDHFDHPLTVAEIIAHSSNKGAAQLAMELGDDRFYGYVRAFGFGQRTGLQGGPEVPGILHPPKQWDDLTITRMPMGQGIAVTVMQMHQAMSVIASGGVLLRPQLVKEIRDPTGETVYRFDRTEERRVISERTARTMAGLLAKVATTEGNAAGAAIPGYEVAGKTATAQKYIDGKPSTTHHIASFIGFLPASHPQVVISVVVDDADAHCPGGVAYGAKVAAPLFKHVAEQLIAYPNLDISPAGRPLAPGAGMLAREGGHR